jgi:hypothetical protein
MSDIPTYYDPEAYFSSEERKRREICNVKLTFRSAELARAAAIQAQWGGGTDSGALAEYQCKLCLLWHLSRRHS